MNLLIKVIRDQIRSDQFGVGIKKKKLLLAKLRHILRVYV